mmetsp:Transcript_16970/g.55512  ORF Transcript_16970/g.55512 Transcript_16970/m.55512 type:complete len:284 (+) Transcript_16970:749-1600(+)
MTVVRFGACGIDFHGNLMRGRSPPPEKAAPVLDVLGVVARARGLVERVVVDFAVARVLRGSRSRAPQEHAQALPERPGLDGHERVPARARERARMEERAHGQGEHVFDGVRRRRAEVRVRGEGAALGGEHRHHVLPLREGGDLDRDVEHLCDLLEPASKARARGGEDEERVPARRSLAEKRAQHGHLRTAPGVCASRHGVLDQSVEVVQKQDGFRPRFVHLLERSDEPLGARRLALADKVLGEDDPRDGNGERVGKMRGERRLADAWVAVQQNPRRLPPSPGA